jgi:hypothetical protein
LGEMEIDDALDSMTAQIGRIVTSEPASKARSAPAERSGDGALDS